MREVQNIRSQYIVMAGNFYSACHYIAIQDFVHRGPAVMQKSGLQSYNKTNYKVGSKNQNIFC